MTVILIIECAKNSLQLATALRDNQTPLEQQRSQVIDQRRPCHDQTLARLVQSLNIRLKLALHRNKAHRRPCCGLGNRFSIPVVVLLRLH